MTQTAEALKAELIDEVAKRLRERLSAEQAPAAEQFLRRFYRSVLPDEVLSLAPETLLGACLALWQLGQHRKPGEPRLRVYNPTYEEHGWQTGHSVLEAVNDDMPFLVDSVAMELHHHELVLYQVIHPVVRVERDTDGLLLGLASAEATGSGTIAESYMHFEFDQITDPAKLEELRRRLESVLEDVRLAVTDWPAMCAHIREILSQLGTDPPPLPPEQLEEDAAFLHWLDDNNFTFLGYREADLVEEDGQSLLRVRPETSLGILRKPSLLNGEGHRERALSPEMAHYAQRPELLIVTKSNHRSTVHRPVHLDYVGVKRFADDGRVIGEHRFLGLFTSTAYNRSARSIPLLRKKVASTVERAGFATNSHDGKALVHILETFPRDELFQIGEADLLQTSLGILRVQERQRLALFVREDPFQRFISCLVYVPRDHFNTELRLRIREILEHAFAGTVTAFYTQISDLPLAQVHFVVRTTPGEVPEYNVAQIEARLVTAARTWTDRLKQVLVERSGGQRGLGLLRRYAHAFPTAYREAFQPESVLSDIDALEEVLRSGSMRLSLYRSIATAEARVRFKVYHTGEELALSDILPKLENMGLRVLAEIPYEVHPAGDAGAPPDSAWIRDFELASPEGQPIDIGAAREQFQETLQRVWQGEVEDDGFNHLVVRAGLSCQQVVVLRAYCKYMRQMGVTFSQRYIEATLARNSVLARLLVELFAVRFDPRLPAVQQDGAEAREAAAEELRRRIREALDQVSNLDEDRIVRLFLKLIEATLRTNFYQHGADGGCKPYLAFKFASKKLSELPQPRPHVEIFVYSPRFEGIHLRGGRVARGGLRWSDRPEDFRTEVLGLMKAQMVKNAVIVPVGSKGGFVVKRPPAGRQAYLEEGQACYRLFIRGLLDLTDNLQDGAVVQPPDLVRYDGDDPYLVVAADKGTATFSDIANEVAAGYGFWLGDAFASGGRTGYDHKKMAITARGGWECVKRHFRELGMDIQNEDFTAVGVGDMSGDVFGNAMLLSPHLRLVGAFNHLHIFIDPEPDAETGFAERKRLFELPGSTWKDYNPQLISAGGGVFERSAKTIPLSPEVMSRLGLSKDTVAPNDLIKALLKTQVDLLWFGGIGTYVKASDESHADTGDRSNDGVRIQGQDLRCRVVGEGANLGLTQRGRVEFALGGGKINTDFIDNSGGVDCSDHEVNIKILLDGVVASGELTHKHRNQLLEEMTQEVAQLVLRDNYLQSQAISVEASRGVSALAQQRRTIRALERAGKLKRRLEALPDDDALDQRLSSDQGLTRPEIAVLLSYAKLTLFEQLMSSDLPDDPLLVEDLVRYFPEPLQSPYRAQIEQHRLRREIIATHTTNSMVNRVGPTFITRMAERTSKPPSEIARAYIVVRDAFRLRPLWAEIEALDNLVPAALQLAMIHDSGDLVEQATAWLLRRNGQRINVTASVDELGAGVDQLSENLANILPPSQSEHLGSQARGLESGGVPAALARQVASLLYLASACDIVHIAGGQRPIPEVGRTYFAIGERFSLSWLREKAGDLVAKTAMQKEAVAALLDDLFAHQRDITRCALDSAGDTAEEATASWLQQHHEDITRIDSLLEDIRTATTVDLAALTVANHQLRRLASC